jgi:hypothetical protein
MTHAEEVVVVVLVVAATVGRLFYQARGGRRQRWMKLRGRK